MLSRREGDATGRAGRLVAAAAAVALVSAVTLTGCAGAPEHPGELDVVRIGFITKFPAAFYDEIIQGANQYAVAHPEVRVTFAQSQAATDDEGQISLIQKMIDQRVNAIAITPTSPKVQAALQRAVDAGIKVVLVDNDIPDWRGKLSIVGTDNLAGGKLAGQWLDAHLPDDATIAILQGRADNPSLNDRVKGLKAEFAGRIRIVAEPETECDQTMGRNAVRKILADHPDVSAIYSACGPPTTGALEALEAAGRKPGDITLVGFDASAAEVDAIAAGTQNASVAQFPVEMGLLGVSTAVVAVRGYNVATKVDTGTEMVTKANVYRWMR